MCYNLEALTAKFICIFNVNFKTFWEQILIETNQNLNFGTELSLLIVGSKWTHELQSEYIVQR